MTYRLGVDVGGTFTDLLLVDETSGKTYMAKVPSTPEDSSIGVLNGVARICDESGVDPKQISKVMKIIRDIAGQTRLIAFNAGIEASGAGQSGKRFGVVAGEIRRLADSVSASTEEIVGAIEGIRGITDYIPGPDMGTNEAAMAFIRDEGGRSAGLPRELGGIPLDEIGATAFGLMVCADVAKEKVGMEFAGMRVAVQGFGAVGKHAARFFAEKGATIVAAADITGAVYDAAGLDVAALVAHEEADGDMVDFDEATTRTATRWLTEMAPSDQPWVLWVPLIFPHPPFTVEEPWFSLHDRTTMPDPIPSDTTGKPGFMGAYRDVYGWGDLTADDPEASGPASVLSAAAMRSEKSSDMDRHFRSRHVRLVC